MSYSGNGERVEVGGGSSLGNLHDLDFQVSEYLQLDMSGVA